ncbi:glycoside hydrolase family 30 beta sandwich domain-containing protein [Hymenobacter sp. M29]|uniref:Glycoside hydrolase family 30 beta sandwich domain-containing protein n=1 Tax=Hymenobacter mellowenesis TaxID=3063995 RepID=A0ABT9A6Q1_9BACT|nr:glycoside hydrolase family 30 beta sandwich domain-containing protein [Hymenobacter sp. M29]MDO7845499.1 glycoside hydrolase family 30 beta sandwich domain-containing protein [Hymenobacter sp. M29]
MPSVSVRCWGLSALFALAVLPGYGQQRSTKVKTKTTTKTSAPARIDSWVTTPDQSQLLQMQPAGLAFGAGAATGAVIEVDDSQTYQTMDGFGYCLTGGSAQLLHAMSPAKRAELLRELFGTGEKAIGISYLRLSIGASDLDAQVFSYDDLPAGQTDPTLARFSLAPDEQHLIPVLKEILAINPAIKLLGSPWSPPAWMKTNEATKGGSLKPEYYAAYAQYFVKYLQGMKAQGIRLDAITVQNEPLHPGNNPSLLMLAEQQAEFIGKHLGPAFKAAKLDTKIICYDHNADKPEYPLTVLGNAEANPYVDGSAFHLYGGPIEALSKVHDAYPTKNLYFTEQWVGSRTKFEGNLGWHTKNMFIGAPRNWARTVLEWNLAADPEQKPYTPGGCNQCLGAITLAGDVVTRNVAYYTVAQSSKFVRPGAVRVGSTSAGVLPNVAYRTPTGGHVLLVFNDQATPQTFSLRHQGRTAAATLPAGAVATYVW